MYPHTVIRHCLYLGDKVVSNRALRKTAQDNFDAWLVENMPPEEGTGA